MRVVVTGSEGQLGRPLAAWFAREPHRQVLGLDLPDHDLTDRDHVLAVLGQFAPDVVVHCAAMTDVDGCEVDPEQALLVNAVATRFVAEGARRVGAHVVHVSTDYVFDGTKDSPYQEWDLPNPRSVYGATKLAAETEIDPGWTIARTSWLCGADGHNMVHTLRRLAGGDGTVRFVEDQRGHPTFTSDLVPMLGRLALGRVAGVFHTTNQGAVSWYEFAREVFAQLGADPDRVEPISTAQLDPPRPAPRPANSVLDDVAWRAAGFERSRDFREPLAELLAQLHP